MIVAWLLAGFWTARSPAKLHILLSGWAFTAGVFYMALFISLDPEMPPPAEGDNTLLVLIGMMLALAVIGFLCMLLAIHPRSIRSTDGKGYVRYIMSPAPKEGQTKVSVRRATSTDVETLIALMHDFYAESDYALDHQWADASFRELLASPAVGCVWLASSDAEPIGHAVLTVRYAMEHGGLSGYVDDLYVRPDFRRMGAGNALLNELFAECRRRGCKSSNVEVGEDNLPARGLYEKFGLLAAQDGRVLLSGVLPKTGD